MLSTPIPAIPPRLWRAEQYITRVVASGWVGCGPLTTAFEHAFAAHLNYLLKHSRPPSATMRCFIQLRYLVSIQVMKVIMPSISFRCCANSGRRRTVARLADVDPYTLNSSVNSLDAVRSHHRSRALLLIHYGGVPCDMREILNWARFHNITVIEDSACSPRVATGRSGVRNIW